MIRAVEYQESFVIEVCVRYRTGADLPKGFKTR